MALTLSQQVRAAGAVLVTTPQDVALADVVRAKQMFDKLHIPLLGIVENMSEFVCPHCHGSTPIFDQGGGKRAADAMAIPFLGSLPLEPKVRQGGDRGIPVVVGVPDSKEANAFLNLSKMIAGRISQENLRSPLPVDMNPSFPGQSE